jgi:hypothetical protein
MGQSLRDMGNTSNSASLKGKLQTLEVLYILNLSKYLGSYSTSC